MWLTAAVLTFDPTMTIMVHAIMIEAYSAGLVIDCLKILHYSLAAGLGGQHAVDSKWSTPG